MKLRYLFSIALSAIVLLTGCVKDANLDSFDNIKLESSYLSLSKDGGSVSVKITSTEDWAFVVDDNWPDVITRDKKTQEITKSEPSWLSADRMSGPAGETTVTFTAEANPGREIELKIKAGANTQFIRIRQGDLAPVVGTVKDIISGPQGKNYTVTGKCVSIANTQYGNWYLQDDSTDELLYIYGTKNEDGEYAWSDFNIEVGDEVTVQGAYVLYGGSTHEFVDALFISVQKALVKVASDPVVVSKEGGEFEVKVAYKGSGLFPTIGETEKSWISVVGMTYKEGIPSKIEPNPADTALVTVAVQPNDAGNREGCITFASEMINDKGKKVSSSVDYVFTQEGAIIETTADKINAAEDGATLYRLTGVVKSIANGKYGNIYISDYTGEVYVYGTYDLEGNRFDAFTTPVKEGDIVTVCGVKTSYNGSPQMKNVTVEKHTQVTPATVADFLAAAEAKDVYYSLTGTVSGLDKAGVYGNVYLTDDTDQVYVYGLLTGWGGPKKEFETLVEKEGLVEGDIINIVGVRTSYNGTPQVGSAFFVKKIEE